MARAKKDVASDSSDSGAESAKTAAEVASELTAEKAAPASDRHFLLHYQGLQYGYKPAKNGALLTAAALVNGIPKAGDDCQINDGGENFSSVKIESVQADGPDILVLKFVTG